MTFGRSFGWGVYLAFVSTSIESIRLYLRPDQSVLGEVLGSSCMDSSGAELVGILYLERCKGIGQYLGSAFSSAVLFCFVLLGGLLSC